LLKYEERLKAKREES